MEMNILLWKAVSLFTLLYSLGLPGCDGCNETFHADSNDFHSPNYPQKYPDEEYCSWRITISPSHQVYLMFTYFSLQFENNTDSVYVYDGDKETGEVLGVFYGGHRPPRKEYIPRQTAYL
ncbi:hypothetical protein OS493_029801 [Desmophyllum pertusum]|uniref:CUB domain-containing protein n=1 Tax=Desmophyllum pertusum TaxID=174260 RepID=A0A9W9YWS4_9CNID|nr:hypothetical protein OS493_029801 [Desmophyllum pertusum]